MKDHETIPTSKKSNRSNSNEDTNDRKVHEPLLLRTLPGRVDVGEKNDGQTMSYRLPWCHLPVRWANLLGTKHSAAGALAMPANKKLTANFFQEDL